MPVIEDEPVGFAFHCTELLKDSDEAFRGVVSAGEEVGVPGGAISLFGPKLEQKCSLEDENITIAGAAEAVENSFEAIFDQEQAEIRVALASKVEQFLADGSGKVFRSWIGQLEGLQIRPHDIGDAADLGGGPEFVHRRLLGAAGFLQRFDGDIQADFIPELETVGNGFRGAEDPQGSAGNSIFLHAEMKGWSGHADDSDG